MLIHSSCLFPNSCLHVAKNALLFKASADGHNTEHV
jgi:hypothetical protein